jgi:diphthamide biosynthesis protein 4
LKQHHPDKSSGNDTTAQQVLKAWDTLRNPENRKKYDIELESLLKSNQC